MLVIYNCLTYGKVIAITVKPLTVAHYYERMKLHGLGLTYCQWIVPGTIEA